MQAWKKNREVIAYQGWRQIIQKFFELPNGKEARFDIIGNNSFVTIAAITKEMEFILVNQFRPGPEDFLTSFPEGYLEPGESPEECAKRELLEETGYQAGSVKFIKKTRSAYSIEERFTVLAIDCQKVGTQQLDPNEFIEVELMAIPAFRDFLKDPDARQFTNLGSAYLALDNLGLLSFSSSLPEE